MSVQNFIPELWIARILAKLRKAYVYAALCNREYEGEIRQAGDTVRIGGIGPVTIRNYDPGVPLVSEELEDEQQILRIDQQKYFNFQVDDVDRAQANVNLLAAGMEEAADGLADAVDQYIAGFYTQAGSTTQLTAVNSLNVLAFLLTLGQALTENNVPRVGRFAVIPPWMTTKLTLAKVLLAADVANDAFTNGYVGRAAGFDLYESNNVPTTNQGTEFKIMAGTTKAMSYAEQLTKTEAYRVESSFKDGVKGLLVYGGKVVYPDALVVGDCTQAAEP